MKSSQATTKTMVLVLLAAAGSGLWAYSHGAEERVSRDMDRSSREYEVVVPPIKSDMERMVEAYERLSDQYLTLVQSQLQGMDASQRMILQKLESIEKKLDELARKVEPPTPAQPAEPKP
jgi:redox-regulated HSP33 family molecular chaperone